MARTKKQRIATEFLSLLYRPPLAAGRIHPALQEDLKKGKDDSNSVINQRDLLNDFYQKHIGEFESVSEYVDDGHTGTDANRENFQRLLSDVMSEKKYVGVKNPSPFAQKIIAVPKVFDNPVCSNGVPFLTPC